MRNQSKWFKRLYIFGVVLFLLGSLDPLEGSVLILLGCASLVVATRLKGDRHRNEFLLTFIMILFGVAFLFYLSALGGFGGESNLSWWWATLILPYPIGWLITVIILIRRWISNKKVKTV